MLSLFCFFNNPTEGLVFFSDCLQFIDCDTYAFQIYEAQPPVSVAFKTKEFVPIPRLLSMVMITTVAPVCNKTMFTQGLNVSLTWYSSKQVNP